MGGESTVWMEALAVGVESTDDSEHSRLRKEYRILRALAVTEESTDNSERADPLSRFVDALTESRANGRLDNRAIMSNVDTDLSPRPTLAKRQVKEGLPLW